jgi:23S rRNA pseudouridine2605 synthase
MAEERLQKILANAGIASRRKAEEYIVAGRVSVNGKTVTELGSKADLETDRVKVDGRVLSAPTHRVYIAFHKPKNCVTTVRDPEGRETVMKFFKGFPERIYPVGRLDYASEGLLLLTNDGDFANKLMSPSSNVTKTYLAKVTGILTTEQEEQFRHGIPMHGRKTAPAGLKIVKKSLNPWYEVRLIEGRQNQIRIMFKHLGFLVEKLKRVKIGFLELGNLKPGAYRTLTNTEVARFEKLLEGKGEQIEHKFQQRDTRTQVTEKRALEPRTFSKPLAGKRAFDKPSVERRSPETRTPDKRTAGKRTAEKRTPERHTDDERRRDQKIAAGSKNNRGSRPQQQSPEGKFRSGPVSAKARVSHPSGKPQRKRGPGRAGLRDRQ